VLFQPDAPFGLLAGPSGIGPPPPAQLLGFAPAIPAFAAPGFDGLFTLPPSPSLSEGDEAPPLAPNPAVPEFATWLQMVVAIGMLGLVLRRSRDVRSHACRDEPAFQGGDCNTGNRLPKVKPQRGKRLAFASGPNLVARLLAELIPQRCPLDRSAARHLAGTNKLGSGRWWCKARTAARP
jgi:hypothetical protein